jgi:hypothetical protein
MPSVIGTDDDTPPKGFGVKGTSAGGEGVVGISTSNTRAGVSAVNDSGGSAVGARSTTGIAVRANSNSGAAVFANSISGDAVIAESQTGHGIFASSDQNVGVEGVSNGQEGVRGTSSSPDHAGVSAVNDSGGSAVGARSTTGTAVFANSNSGVAVFANSNSGAAVIAQSQTGHGIFASSHHNVGVEGTSITDTGVKGTSKNATGVYGESSNVEHAGVFGSNNVEASNAWGIKGVAKYGIGVYATGGSGAGFFEGDVGINGSLNVTSVADFGVVGFGGVGVLGQANGQTPGQKAIFGSVQVTRQQGGQGWSGYFDDAVHVNGFLEKAGGGFKIDHPEDPANKYLNHSFVESAEMKNIYDGTVTLDAHGKATVTMPSWFEVLNRSFCYQLTSIGTSSPELHIASELQKGKFQIAGGKPVSKVSWQVTGVRNDAWAKANQIPLEEEKSHGERGHYLHPSLFGQSADKSVLAVHQPTHFEILKKKRERDR